MVKKKVNKIVKTKLSQAEVEKRRSYGREYMKAKYAREHPPKTEEEKAARIAERKEKLKKYHREYKRKYYKKNKERLIGHQIKWQKANKEKLSEYQKNHRIKNGEKVRKYFRDRRHAERTPAQKRAYNKKIKLGDKRLGDQIIGKEKKNATQ